MGTPAFTTQIRKAGTPTAFLEAPMSEDTSYDGEGYLYVIDDELKSVWERTTPVRVYGDGVEIDYDDYRADYLFGRVLFQEQPNEPVTVTGEYLPIGGLYDDEDTRIPGAHSHDLNLEMDLLDNTNYVDVQDQGGYRSRVTGLLDASISLERYDDSWKEIRKAFSRREPVLIDVRPGNEYTFRGWFVVESNEQSGSVDDLESNDLNFQLDNLVDHKGRQISMGWKDIIPFNA